MATTEQFSLRWNNFHSNIASGFHDLLEAADLVDVTLAVEGQFLHAHKLVLSICSPYFKEMFKQNPCKHPIIILKDVTHKNLKDILEFMYLGEVNVLRENLPVFLRTAELLQVKGLSCDDTVSNYLKICFMRLKVIVFYSKVIVQSHLVAIAIATLRWRMIKVICTKHTTITKRILCKCR